MQVESAAATHTGRVRTVNEDAFLALPQLVVVADGMGGHASGDVASALAVTVFAELGERVPIRAEDVALAVDRANTAIVAEAEAHPEKAGMGTTISGLAVVDEGGSPHWLVFNIGDSRVYRIANGTLHQLTVDHSEVAGLVATGRITERDALTHPLRHVITRSLGVVPSPVPDTWLVPVTVGDLFLVCSDGLTNELPNIEIARVVTGAPRLADAADTLVEAAVAAGGRDNVTVVLVATVEDKVVSGESMDSDTSTIPRKRLSAPEPRAGAAP